MGTRSPGRAPEPAEARIAILSRLSLLTCRWHPGEQLGTASDPVGAAHLLAEGVPALGPKKGLDEWERVAFS